MPRIVSVMNELQREWQARACRSSRSASKGRRRTPGVSARYRRSLRCTRRRGRVSRRIPAAGMPARTSSTRAEPCVRSTRDFATRRAENAAASRRMGGANDAGGKANHAVVVALLVAWVCDVHPGSAARGPSRDGDRGSAHEARKGSARTAPRKVAQRRWRRRRRLAQLMLCTNEVTRPPDPSSRESGTSVFCRTTLVRWREGRSYEGHPFKSTQRPPRSLTAAAMALPACTRVQPTRRVRIRGGSMRRTRVQREGNRMNVRVIRPAPWWRSARPSS